MTDLSYSIVMTTYNGEKYIYEQLQSLFNQTVTPKEVLIFDDCSTDSTIKSIHNFITNHHLDWKLIINSNNRGWKKNFMMGLAQARYELIFLCDQDDVWNNDKCEIMISALNSNPGCNLLMSNYTAFAEDKSVKIPISMRYQKNNKKIYKIELNIRNLVSVLRPGCTYLLKNSFFKKISPFYIEGVAHDRFIYQLGVLTESAYLIQTKTINFRRHNSNNSPLNIKTRKARIQDLNEMLEMTRNFNRVIIHFENSSRNRPTIILDKLYYFYQLRKNYYCNPSVHNFLKLCFTNITNYPFKKTLIGDLLIGLRKN